MPFKIFNISAALLAWQSPTKKNHHIVSNLSKDVGLTIGQTYEIIGVLIGIIKLFLQNSPSDYNARLTELGFPPNFISNLSLEDNRKELISNLRRHSINNFNKLSALKWRIDISLMDR